MEAINGITFEDWAYACGNLAQGMSEDEICKVLGVELPVWSQTSDAWAAKLGDMMAEDMSIATKYSEMMTNPKQGKFADAGADAPSLDDLLKIAPDYDAYYKISSHQSAAHDVGIDPTSVIESYGLNIGTWSQLNMHYMKWRNEFTSEGSGTPMEKERYDQMKAIHDKWNDHWKAHYADQKVDLAGDIDF